MPIVYKVTVKDDYRWPTAQVNARVFSKRQPVEIGEAAMTAEILNSELLDIETIEVEPEPVEDEPNITAGASKLAQEAGLDASIITGTGKDGRITQADVEAAIEAKQ